MGNNQPVIKKRLGRFQVSIWKSKKIQKARNDYDIEREIEVVRACIQHSQYTRTTNKWTNQTIWCNPDELRSIAQLLDELNGSEKEPTQGGEEQCVIQKFMQ